MEVPVNGVAKGIEAAEAALSASGSRKILSKLGRALKIRIGFWGILYYTFNKEPPKIFWGFLDCWEGLIGVLRFRAVQGFGFLFRVSIRILELFGFRVAGWASENLYSTVRASGPWQYLLYFEGFRAQAAAPDYKPWGCGIFRKFGDTLRRGQSNKDPTF